MTDWTCERVRALVAAAENAVQRVRWVFLLLTLGCAIMITAQLNLYGSWVRNVHKRAEQQEITARYNVLQQEIIARDEERKREILIAPDDVTKNQQLKKVGSEQQLDEVNKVRFLLDKVLWDDLYNVQMPLLGIKYSADDLIVLGTATMAVLALWFVYAHRRENHCISDLAGIATKAKEPGMASFIHSAVAHHFVFTTTTENDAINRGRVTNWLLELPLVNKVRKRLRKSPLVNKVRKWLLRWPVIGLAHLPWVSSLLAVVVMIYILFVPGVEMVVVPDNSIPAFDQFEPFEQREALLRIAVGLIFTILTAYYCFKAQAYDKQTHQLLVKMEKAASADQA